MAGPIKQKQVTVANTIFCNIFLLIPRLLYAHQRTVEHRWPDAARRAAFRSFQVPTFLQPFYNDLLNKDSARAHISACAFI
ncbi:MAG: hypothetical protein USCAAHI_00940 [Beijerinckiaceae bacterium]|nr:MAG: hypothetical protein USCAAHI_00940 [Beijerinckiaceae bacterium]